MMIRMITMVMKMRLRNKRFRPTNLQTCPGIPTWLCCPWHCSARSECMYQTNVFCRIMSTWLIQWFYNKFSLDLGPNPSIKSPVLKLLQRIQRHTDKKSWISCIKINDQAGNIPEFIEKNTFISAPCTTIAWNKLCKGNPGISHVPAWACQFLSCFFKSLIALSFQMPGIYRSLEQLLEIEPGLKQFLCQGQQTMPE